MALLYVGDISSSSNFPYTDKEDQINFLYLSRLTNQTALKLQTPNYTTLIFSLLDITLPYKCCICLQTVKGGKIHPMFGPMQ